MNLKRLAIITITTYGLCALWAITGVQETTADLTIAPRETITLQDLTPQQQIERAVELTSTTSTTTSTTTTVQPSTTVVAVPADTKCQEWFPTAISVGWPNDPAVLEKLGRLLYKETRCQNVSYTHPQFNGHDHGVAQINEIHTKWVEELFNMPFRESMSDPTLNLRFAYLLYEATEESGGCGWKPWSLC